MARTTGLNQCSPLPFVLLSFTSELFSMNPCFVRMETCKYAVQIENARTRLTSRAFVLSFLHEFQWFLAHKHCAIARKLQGIAHQSAECSLFAMRCVASTVEYHVLPLQ